LPAAAFGALGGFLELGNDGCALAGFAVLTDRRSFGVDDGNAPVALINGGLKASRWLDSPAGSEAGAFDRSPRTFVSTSIASCIARRIAAGLLIRPARRLLAGDPALVEVIGSSPSRRI